MQKTKELRRSRIDVIPSANSSMCSIGKRKREAGADGGGLDRKSKGGGPDELEGGMGRPPGLVGLVAIRAMRESHGAWYKYKYGHGSHLEVLCLLHFIPIIPYIDPCIYH